MRADRLLKLILALSDGRRRTAQQLADQLEVSERTIYRDLDALTEAGVPVRTTRGPDGGVELPEQWRRAPTGLTTPEAAALAVLGVPSSLGALEGRARTALAKVVAGLPPGQRVEAEAARRRLLVDPSPWWSGSAAPASLDRLLDAVWGDRQVRLAYTSGEGRRSEPTLDALALVLKADRWYLVGGTPGGPRIYRGDRITAVEVLDETFARPDLDLPRFWAAHARRFVAERPSFPVELRAGDEGRRRLAEVRPEAEREGIRTADPLIVDFQRVDIAIGQLAPLAEEVTVVGPPELVARLRRIGAAWAG